MIISEVKNMINAITLLTWRLNIAVCPASLSRY